ncbi:MAG: peptide deformylase [Armatimonadota bacterium]|nr:peptide deformylase [Armatimonadota bacterium]MDR7402627.1 peptide deformylase [Armatimonadota bacterium]MDR7436771.1 peptide deformylase [Armatimonadota bacterium]MDR7472718.1 peptide deformylase [Armatimonadota bacterium]MDR7506991.1 peptide deformylase [Armatimonadota bacterium]
MKIVTVDSPQGAVLRRRARPVGRVTEQVRALMDEMFLTMRAAGGIGLAAPQVGVGLRVIVAEVDRRRVALADPVIVRAEGQEVGTEGCLSIPGVVAEVPRAARVTVRGKNRRGRGVTVTAEGLLSRVLQHEIDHLDGILFLDRVVDRSTIRQVGQTAEVEAAVSG